MLEKLKTLLAALESDLAKLERLKTVLEAERDMLLGNKPCDDVLQLAREKQDLLRIVQENFHARQPLISEIRAHDTAEQLKARKHQTSPNRSTLKYVQSIEEKWQNLSKLLKLCIAANRENIDLIQHKSADIKRNLSRLLGDKN